MTSIDSLCSLQQRIRSSSGPDRELDCLIACELLGGKPYISPNPFVLGSAWRRNVGGAYFEVPDLTASLDACVALMREVLPGWQWCKSPDESFEVWRQSTREQRGVFARARPLATDCHTFLDAIISAEISELESAASISETEKTT